MASRLFPFLVLPLLAACAESGPADNSRCVMHEVASMPVLNDRGQPIVKVRVNGTPVAFMVDTGARLSTMSPEATETLRLPVDHDHYVVLGGVGGSTMAYRVEVGSLDLGTAAAHRVDLYEAGSFGKRTAGGLPLAGLLGGDFLANYDVEFDLPDHRVSLYSEQRCNKDFALPWAGTVYKHPFTLEDDTAIRLDARVAGAPVRLQLDSGALTVLDLHTAFLAGATPETMTKDRTFLTQGIDGNVLTARIHRFASLEVGDERIEPDWLAVADIQSSSLLGADFLRRNRVWVSYPHEFLWIQPVGRFRLEPPPHG